MKPLFLGLLFTISAGAAKAQAIVGAGHYGGIGLTRHQPYAAGAADRSAYTLIAPGFGTYFIAGRRFFAGGYGGFEIGINSGEDPLYTRIDFGPAAGFKISDEAAVALRYCFNAKALAFQQTSSDDGWIIGATATFRNFMLDVAVPAPAPVSGSRGWSLFREEMDKKYLMIVPRYNLHLGKRSIQIGLRYERYRDGQKTDAGASKLTNLQLLVGKRIGEWRKR